jgi:integrase
MARLERVGEKKYRIVYDVPPTNGRVRQQKTETLEGVTKVEAQAILAKRKEAAATCERVADPSITVSELFEKFMGTRRRLAATTRDRYNSLYVKYIRPDLGSLKLASLKKVNLIEAYAAWEARGERRPSGRTIRHAHDLVRATLNWAVSLDYIATNVAAKVTAADLPRMTKPENTVLDETELRRLLAEAKEPTKRAKARGTLSSQPWFYPAIAFAAYTGARRGEVLAVKWADLDLDDASVTIRSSLAEPKSGLAFKEPKNGKVRSIVLPSQLVAILRTHRERQASERLAFGEGYQDQGLVMARPDGTPVPPWNFGAAFKDLVARAGVTPISLHDLRDTHASLLAKAGVPIEVVSQRLGHSGIGVTVERYLTVYTSRDAAAAEAFQRLVR